MYATDMLRILRIERLTNKNYILWGMQVEVLINTARTMLIEAKLPLSF